MRVNVLLFDDFETLDVFGPVEILGKVEEYELHYGSLYGGEIISAQDTRIMTERIDLVNTDGILVVPGGKGTRTYVDNEAFLASLQMAVEKAAYCLSICTGSALLAKTGLLDGKVATSNKKAFDWVRSTGENVQWKEKARWAVDGKYYTSSGVSAGIDMTLGFVRDQLGMEKAVEIANQIEYIWNYDCDNDLFCRNEGV